MWNLKCEGKVFSLSHDMRNKDAKKTIIVYSHDSEFSIPLQCNIINLKSFLQYVSTFVIVGCRQIKKLKKKTTRVGVSKSQETQNTETATEICSIERVVWQKALLESSSSGNAVKITKKEFEGAHF